MTRKSGKRAWGCQFFARNIECRDSHGEVIFIGTGVCRRCRPDLRSENGVLYLTLTAEEMDDYMDSRRRLPDGVKVCKEMVCHWRCPPTELATLPTNACV
jgi:hypothetical protein